MCIVLSIGSNDATDKTKSKMTTTDKALALISAIRASYTLPVRAANGGEFAVLAGHINIADSNDQGILTLAPGQDALAEAFVALINAEA